MVTALHHIPNGEVWPIAEIQKRQASIRNAGLEWSVVESIPVHEDIKRRTGRWKRYIANYQENLRRLAQCGIYTVCYNFMPVLDWTRTDLHYRLPDGAEALRLDMAAMAAFDCFILKRPHAHLDYPADLLVRAEDFFQTRSPQQIHQLTQTLLAGLPGAEEAYSLEDFRQRLQAYGGIDASALRQHLVEFLQHIAPIAQEVGVRLAIHPDDPPWPIFGLPRVVSSAEDIAFLLHACDVPANGICFCTGSFGARPDNCLPDMVRHFNSRIHFLHLRSVQLEPDGSFFEAEHLGGSTNMAAVMAAIVDAPDHASRVPMRPDHGHRILDDLHKTTNPGYSAIGRLKGLAELRGLEMGIRAARGISYLHLDFRANATSASS